MALRSRKNQASLTAQEKSRFVAALLALKADGRYDQYVQTHMNAMQAAHRGPAFLPWHREFLRRLELDLQTIDATVTLPYWDWTIDRSATSSLWDPSFMGGDGRPSDGQVMTGPFALSGGDWPLAFDGPDLRRRFGISAPALPSPTDATAALEQTVYDVAPWTMSSSSGFRNRLEGWISGPQLHNLVHVWVGGSMLPMSSPNDPVFFLHHCFVDKLWADWQRLHSSAGYLPASGAAAGHNLGDAMQPWAGMGQVVTPASVLNHHALGYRYDTDKVAVDYDGDGKTDFAVWRPGEGNWYIIDSSTGANRVQQWGQAGDIPVPGDYDGDGKTDFAVWRPGEGNWYIIDSSTGANRVQQWGQAGDIPVPGDYDGDGKTDFAVWRPGEGNWYIIDSSTGANRVQQWGQAGDIPVPGDYDGDGKTDFAVWRPGEGNWYIIDSSTGATRVRQWGQAGDIPVPGDYDGDGKTDFAVWRPGEGNWYIIDSSTGATRVQQWGQPGDIPVPGDYDGDGKTDFAVWRPGEGNWYIIDSSTGATRVQQWGQAGDIPV